jgi:hypothetical protein
MSEELKRIEQLEEEIRKLKGLNKDGIPTFSFSSITIEDLEQLLDIEEKINHNIFNKWFNNSCFLDEKINLLLTELLIFEKDYIKSYNEEDLKMRFLSVIFKSINFQDIENEFRDFYELQITYKTDKFIFSGITDFVLSKGLLKSKKPYFFIQEFKKGKKGNDPEAQLLAELISAVELNKEILMKGAYIIGENWNFVILKKLGKDKYQYFVSRTFNSTNIEDLKGIYRNLMFVKNEIIEIVKRENND